MVEGMAMERVGVGNAAAGPPPMVRREDVRREDRQPVCVLVVSPNAAIHEKLRQTLPQPRWQLIQVATGADALEHLHENESQVLLLDPLLPDLEPMEFMAMVQRRFPRVQILTVNDESGQLVAVSPVVGSSQLLELLYRGGASRPFAPDTQAVADAGGLFRDAPQSSLFSPVGSVERLGERLGRVVRIDRPDAPYNVAVEAAAGPAPALDLDRILRQRTSAEGSRGIRGMVGSSAAMQRVYNLAHMVARRDTTVVVTGESGTGKDLVAQAIHHLSARQRQPFVVINCAAIPEPLLEAELFGYVKGSFTGATQSRIGRIHAAHGGTLFLDEIGDMPLALQSKILRFLEQGEVQRIGGNDNLKVDVRVVAATNADLKLSVERHLFREDLYYRLAVFPIHLPPLRERMEDLQELAEAFLAKFSPGAALGQDALEALQRHTWPGNVRELRNAIERATIMAGEELSIGSGHILA